MPQTHKCPIKNYCIYTAVIFSTIYAGKLRGGRMLKMRGRNWQRKGEKIYSTEETLETKGFPLVMFIILHAPPLPTP